MIAKQDRHQQELDIFMLRTEAGLQALRTWVYSRRDAINESWFHLSGDALLEMKGEARLVARLIKLVDVGPQIKSMEA